MTYIKKKRSRELYLARRELFRCATYRPRIITNATLTEPQDWAVRQGPIWVAA